MFFYKNILYKKTTSRNALSSFGDININHHYEVNFVALLDFFQILGYPLNCYLEHSKNIFEVEKLQKDEQKIIQSQNKILAVLIKNFRLKNYKNLKALLRPLDFCSAQIVHNFQQWRRCYKNASG